MSNNYSKQSLERLIQILQKRLKESWDFYYKIQNDKLLKSNSFTRWYIILIIKQSNKQIYKYQQILQSFQ